MISPELSMRMATWRQKASAGTLSIEEMREAIAALRGSRRTAAEAAPAKRSSSRGPARSADDMLKDLEGL